MSAQYWVAQLVDDVFRDEPRNIGVIVSKDGEVALKFLGQTSAGDVDRRRLRGLSFPEVYLQWIEYWRSTITGTAGIDIALGTSGSNYRIRGGGEVSDAGHDTAADVADYLYSLLVSEGGFREAIGETAEIEASVTLEADLVQEFNARRIFGAEVRHPVMRNVPVIGTRDVRHKPAFIQQNGLLYVMESVDFTLPQKRRARDHAGFSAYMFRDIREARGSARVEPISIIRVNPAEREENNEVSYAVKLLENESRVIDWGNEGQKREFINERLQVALHAEAAG